MSEIPDFPSAELLEQNQHEFSELEYFEKVLKKIIEFSKFIEERLKLGGRLDTVHKKVHSIRAVETRYLNLRNITDPEIHKFSLYPKFLIRDTRVIFDDYFTAPRIEETQYTRLTVDRRNNNRRFIQETSALNYEVSTSGCYSALIFSSSRMLDLIEAKTTFNRNIVSIGGIELLYQNLRFHPHYFRISDNLGNSTHVSIDYVQCLKGNQFFRFSPPALISTKQNKHGIVLTFQVLFQIMVIEKSNSFSDIQAEDKGKIFFQIGVFKDGRVVTVTDIKLSKAAQGFVNNKVITIDYTCATDKAD